MTDQQVSERIRKLDTEQLKHLIAEESKDYTKEALAIAREELASRGEEAAVRAAPPPEPAALPGNVNFVGSLLGWVGYALMGLGVILAVLLFGKTKVVLVVAAAAGPVVAGVLFLGVSEVIKLLMELKERGAPDRPSRSDQ